ncbi:hypothetical protein IHQ56_04740 [Methylobacillus flagellatus]|nr:hypothetical protein [Methylobacillus flagellatus]
MKWIVIATDNAKRLFTLKAYSSGKYSVVETSENITLNFHDAVFFGTTSNAPINKSCILRLEETIWERILSASI